MRGTIDMAREAGFTEGELAFMGDNFRRFADLVRADERERLAKIQFESILQAMKIEREACAKVCESIELDGYPTIEQQQCAAAIRNRGNT